MIADPPRVSTRMRSFLGQKASSPFSFDGQTDPPSHTGMTRIHPVNVEDRRIARNNAFRSPIFARDSSTIGMVQRRAIVIFRLTITRRLYFGLDSRMYLMAADDGY